MILWCGGERGGEGGKMIFQLAAEPGPHALVRAQQERDDRNSRGLYRKRLEEHDNVIAISCDFSIVFCTIADFSIVLLLASLVSLLSDPLFLSSSNSLVVDSDPPSVILAVNVLSSYPITVST